MKERDDRDMNRLSSPLKAADDAITSDTSDLSIDDVQNNVSEIIYHKIQKLL